ncbi:DUF1161 domain-containing protein [Sphaerotilaceae bacterium SBD11-9]
MKLKTTFPTSLVASAALLALMSGGAQAQSAACEEFKNKLASRVDASITAFTLEVVKSSAPVPPGAKVFGTCDGGAYKVLFRRGGDSRPAPAAAPASAASAPAPAPQVAKPVTPPPPPPPPAVAKPAVTPPPPPPAPARPAAASAPSPAASVAQKPPVPAPAPAPQLAKPVGTGAVMVARAPEPAPPPGASVASVTPALDESSIVKGLPAAESVAGPGFIARNWQWLAGLLLLPLVGGLWAWRAHRNAYDEAGLPRGPRL